MIVNGIHKYVTEMTEETQRTTSITMETVQGRPKHTSMTTTPSPTVALPYHQRDWINVEPGQYDKSCFEVSKKMIRLLRHDPSVHREEDGAVADVSFRIYVFSRSFRARITCNKEEVLRRDFSIVWIHTLLIPSCTFKQLKGTSEENTSILH